MHKELFGVFGGHDTFAEHRDDEEFDAVISGVAVTVGVRVPTLGVTGRTSIAESDDGVCTVWGEAFPPDGATGDAAEWLLSQYATEGLAAADGLNGSYVAVVEHDSEAVVLTDQMRSWECFYVDCPTGRVFGTDMAAMMSQATDLTSCRESMLEFLHLGTVLGDQTLFESIHRIPFDGYLTAQEVGELDRFVYSPQKFDYAEELADRLHRAIQRRADYPGQKGVLLSAGQDSRTIVAEIPDIEHCYTLGMPGSQEVCVARQISAQYGATHTTLKPDIRYLQADGDKLQSTQGLRESLHIHHAGYDNELTVDVMYHGLLYDTLFKGYFLEWDGLGLFGFQIPLKRLADDVDPVGSLLDTLGFMPEASERLANRLGNTFTDLSIADPRAFLRERLEAELKRGWSRTDSVHNAMDLLVLRNQPTLSFRTHLADNYLESFVAADRELLEWHLRTPPQHRHSDTVSRALHAFDSDVMRYRPPSRPHDTQLLNQAERLIRRKLPLLEPFESAWPDRRDIYDRHDLDDYYFPDDPAIHSMPVRQKLRVNDMRWWLS